MYALCMLIVGGAQPCCRYLLWQKRYQ